MNTKLIAAAFFFIIILFNNLAKTNIAGAPAGHSGAPGEGNCTSCHAGQPISQAPNLMASFSQYNLPVQTLFRGQTYQVKVRLNGLNHNYGFQFSAKNPATGLPVGFFNTFSGTSPIGSSIQQNQFGTTSNTPQGREWSFEFVTPSTYTGDSIVFYVAGMLGNQDGQVTGDQVLLQSYRFAVSSGTPPTPPAISLINSPSQVCQGTIGQITYNASGTFDTTQWLYLELSENNNQFFSPKTLDSTRAKPVTNGQFFLNASLLPGGNHFLRIREKTGNVVSQARPISILTLDTPVLDYYDAAVLLGLVANPVVGIIGGAKANHSYSWTFNGTPIPGPSNLDYVDVDSFGHYQVRAMHQQCPNLVVNSTVYEYTPFVPTYSIGNHVCLPYFQCISLPLIRNRLYSNHTQTQFYLQLSDSTGNFSDSSTVLYTGRLVNNVNALLWIGLPHNLTPNGQYRLRGKITSPTYYSPIYPLFTVSKSPNTPIIVNNNGILRVTNPSSRIRWIRKGEGVIPFANSASFFPLISGTYYAQQYDSSCFSEFSNEITIVFTGINELNHALTLAPNPANAFATLESTQIIEPEQIILTELSGKRVTPVIFQESDTKLRIETTGLSNGIYLLQHQNQRVKLVVQH